MDMFGELKEFYLIDRDPSLITIWSLLQHYVLQYMFFSENIWGHLQHHGNLEILLESWGDPSKIPKITRVGDETSMEYIGG